MEEETKTTRRSELESRSSDPSAAAAAATATTAVVRSIMDDGKFNAQMAADLLTQWETPSTPPNSLDYLLINGVALLFFFLFFNPKQHSSISRFLFSPDGLIDCFFLLLSRSARKPEMQALDLSVCCFPHVVVFNLSVCLHVGKRIVRPYFFEFLAHVRGFLRLAPLQSSLSIQALPTVSFFLL